MDTITRAKRKYTLRSKRSNENLDRFIPNRSASRLEYARSMITGRWKAEEDSETGSPNKEAYRRRLRKAFDMNNTRIFSYKNKPPAPFEIDPAFYFAAVRPSKSVKPQRYIRQTAERVLAAPEISDDYYLNILNWGCSNVLAIALGSTVYMWNAASASVSELVTVDEDVGQVTSVSWAPDGRHIAVGLNNSHIQLWDSETEKQLRTLKGGHGARVGSLAWNKHILTSGSLDSSIINNDVRIRNHITETYRGHHGEICGLKWSPSGQQLASGANDNLLCIWDRTLASTNSITRTQWLHRIEDHSAAVRALAWCPFQSNLLASGGGFNDQCIRFWNTHTGACLNSVDTGSQVCALLWNKYDRELLSAHGLTENQLTLWKYPSMVKMAELTGHSSRVLSMVQSPDGTVASAAGDETLRFWNVFKYPEAAKPAEKATREHFPNVNRIR